MSLKDILAARKAGLEVQKKVEDVTLPTLKNENENENEKEEFSAIKKLLDREDELQYLYQPPPYEVDEDYFISAYSLYFLNPYQISVTDWRILRDYLLDENFYILNTFPLLDSTALFQAFMKHRPPTSAGHLHALYMCISELHLHVPGKFLAQILVLLEKTGG